MDLSRSGFRVCRRRVAFVLGAVSATAILSGCSDADTSEPSEPAPRSATSASAEQRYQPPRRSAAELRAIFSYDETAPLEVRAKGAARRRSDARVQTVTYANGSGGRADALLVTPVGEPIRRSAGVVFGFGYGGSKEDFLGEAVALASRGVVAVLPTTETRMSGKAGADAEALRRSVVSERRALDLLATRDDVDPSRMAYVGHSWGAIRAAIIAGVEPKLAAICYAGFGTHPARYAMTWGGATDQNRYLDSMTRFAPVPYLRMPRRGSVLLQFAEYDRNSWPEAEYDRLESVTAPPVRRIDYPTGHEELQTAAGPAKDRATFLAHRLRLR